MLFIYIVPACLSLHSTSVISVIAHIHGYKTHKINDESRNSWICSVLTLGEGWHNNHHADPGNPNFGKRWWELDTTFWLIKLLRSN